MCEITKKYLTDLITEIVKDNEPFDDEWNFQFTLAVKLKENGQVVDVEKKIYGEGRSRCDLVLTESDGRKILIELKYIYADKKQSAKTSLDARESFVENYNRIKEEVNSNANVKAGFVVFLTNKTAVCDNNNSSSKKEFVEKFHNNFPNDDKDWKWTPCSFKHEKECQLLVVDVNEELK